MISANTDLKRIIVDSAAQLGFQRTVIAALEPMLVEREHYSQWLAQGFAGTMEYLKRNPDMRTSPRLLYPQSVSAIIVSASYYSEPPEHPGPGWGRVANYAVGLDYHPVLRARLRALRERIEKVVGRPLLSKAFTDDVALYEQAFAARYGVGFSGKNTLIIGPGTMGSYHFLAELMTDLQLESDEPYKGTCGKCFRCGSACPTGAIVDAGTVDARRCISYLTIENKGPIPLELRQQIGDWVFGCDVCQEVCPYNRKPPETSWPEFRPESGVGHYLNLQSLLSIETEEEFRSRFLPTAVRRPKRRGLLRNALVVFGNQKPDGGTETLEKFLQTEADPMLREHATWSIAQYRTAKGRSILERILAHERNDETKLLIRLYLERN